MVWPFSGLATLVIQYIKAEDRVFYYFSLCVTILKATGGHKPPSSLIFTLTLLKALGIGIHTQKSKKTPSTSNNGIVCLSKVTFGKIIGKVLLPKW